MQAVTQIGNVVAPNLISVTTLDIHAVTHFGDRVVFDDVVVSAGRDDAMLIRADPQRRAWTDDFSDPWSIIGAD